MRLFRSLNEWSIFAIMLLTLLLAGVVTERLGRGSNKATGLFGTGHGFRSSSLAITGFCGPPNAAISRGSGTLATEFRPTSSRWPS